MKNKFYRLFLALELNNKSKQSISQIINTLQTKHFDLLTRWTPENNLHVTLKFIGETHLDILPTYSKYISNTLSGTRPFYIKIDRFIGLPLQTPHLITLGLERSIALQNLFTKIEDLFLSFGLPHDKHAFIPHITIGKNRYASEAISQLIRQSGKKSFEQQIHYLTLFRTEATQTDRHSLYVPIERFALSSSDISS